MKHFRLVLLALALMPTFSMAQDCFDYSDLTSWAGVLEFSGSIGDVVVWDGHAAITYNDEEQDQHFLKVFDTSDPEQPQVLGSIEIPPRGGQLAVHGNFACVVYNHTGAGFFGLRMIDLTDPANPQMMGGVALPSEVLGLAVAENYLYVACETGLQVIDISNPSNPHGTGSVGLILSASDITINGTLAFVTCGSGLRVLDISNPESPEIVGGRFDLPGFKVVVSENFAYILCRDDFADSFLVILDITDPENLVEVSEFINLYAAGSDMVVAGGIVYVALTNNGLLAVDPGDPENLRTVGHLAMGGASSLAESGEHVFVAGSGGLHVAEIPFVQSPVVGSLDGNSIWNFAISGYYGYSAMYDAGFRVIDIHNPEEPELVAVLDLAGNLQKVSLSGDLAIVIARQGPGSYMLQLVDISSPENPQFLSATGLPYLVDDIIVSGDYVYFTSNEYPSWRGIHVVDISNPASPFIAGSTQTPRHSSALAVSDQYAFVANNHYYDGFYEIQVVSVADPAHPAIVGTLKTPGHIHDLVISGQNLFVCWANRTGSGVLGTANISSPENPFFINQMHLWEKPGRIAVADDYACITGAFGSWGELGYLKVVDLSTPESPHVQGSLFLPPYASVDFSDNNIFIAAGGLMVLPAPCNGTSGADEVISEGHHLPSPESNAHLSVHPNPFNPRTTVTFSVDHPQQVELCIFDMAGKRVVVLANRSFGAGIHSLDWLGRDQNGQPVSSGNYFIRMSTEERAASEKMVLVR